MGLIRINRAEFDPVTMLLHFAVTAWLGASRATVISTIRLSRRPVGDTALRWAIMGHLRKLVA